MERVKTLSEKLNEQLANNAGPAQLLQTVQMLQAELQRLQPAAGTDSSVAVFIPQAVQPAVTAAEVSAEAPVSEPPVTMKAPPERKPEDIPQEERIVEVLQIDEAEVEAELEEIKRNAETRNKMAGHNKPHILFDPVEETPTLTHQQPAAPAPAPPVQEKPQPKELHESIANPGETSLNERLRQSKSELSDALQDVPIKDLRKGIGVNDRFLFIRELFRGDETMYERSIKTINSFAIYAEAEYWIKRELKLKLAWDDRNEVVRQFDQLVRRRFS
jgi:hypothetical protein